MVSCLNMYLYIFVLHFVHEIVIIYLTEKTFLIPFIFLFPFLLIESCQLEKDLREVRFEISEVKFSSERKLSEAHALETGLEEKYLEIEARMHAADAKLAEAGRRNSETNRKLEDIEARERKLQRDCLSLTSEYV